MNKFFFLSVCFSVVFVSCKQKPEEQKSTGNAGTDSPNVIIIYADDLGYGDLSAYGATEIQTPNIDKLAGEGLKFTNGHCASATCTPSRFAMLTGNYAFRKKGTGVLSGNAGLIVPTNKITLPKVFKKAGYKTAVIGKWHLGLGDGSPIDWNKPIQPGPNEVGFDYSFIFPATADRVPTVYMRNHNILGLEEDDPIEVSYRKKVGEDPTGKENPELLKMHPTPGIGHDGTIVNGISRIGWMSGGERSRWTDEEIAHDFYAEAEKFVLDNKETPFFMFFSLSDIHVPRMPDTRFKGVSKLGYRGDAILQMDDTVGRIMRLLEFTGLKENTIVIFSSDNGPILDDGYIDDAITKIGKHKPAGPYRSGKYSIFEGGTRVPFIVSWPSKITPGTSGALVNQVDFLNSFATYYGQGLNNDEAVDSYDIWEALIGNDNTGRADMIEDAFTRAYVEGSWKYIKPAKGREARLSWALDVDGGQETGVSENPQLYDLENDPGEQNNLADKHPEKVEELAGKLERAITNGSSRTMGK